MIRRFKVSNFRCLDDVDLELVRRHLLLGLERYHGHAPCAGAGRRPSGVDRQGRRVLLGFGDDGQPMTRPPKRRITVDDLEVGRVYPYRVVTGDRAAATPAGDERYRIRTAPRPGEGFSFVVFGDPRPGDTGSHRHHRAVARRMREELPDFFDLLANYAGLVCLGGAFFYGVGGYVAALLNAKLGLPAFLSIPLAAVLGGSQSLHTNARDEALAVAAAT